MRRSVNLCLLLWTTWATAQPLVLKTSTILDGKGHVLKNRNIVVENGRIVRISEADEKASYDLSGLTVMPGWIDTHAHFAVHFDSKNRVEEGGVGSKAASPFDATGDRQRAPRAVRVGLDLLNRVEFQADVTCGVGMNDESLAVGLHNRSGQAIPILQRDLVCKDHRR